MTQSCHWDREAEQVADGACLLREETLGEPRPGPVHRDEQELQDQLPNKMRLDIAVDVRGKLRRRQEESRLLLNEARGNGNVPTRTVRHPCSGCRLCGQPASSRSRHLECKWMPLRGMTGFTRWCQNNAVAKCDCGYQTHTCESILGSQEDKSKDSSFIDT
ncbi:hypothetical protein Q8A67_025232 [Cirrhinus molitorella]|uniref:Uncharacterized protein n=1 Tax=Cirrhinus molitorella TaxID=172907 RepID=A0AA88NXB5_9TELE|nr:hypothetical protein Q8A67_025232 [Cirrhinus molitorella]